MDENELKLIENKELEDQRYFARKLNYYERLAKVNRQIEKPKGLFRKKCPKCNFKLIVDPLMVNNIIGFKKVTHYKCSKCGYEYSTRVYYS